MLLCSVAGYDASHRVDDLASAMAKPCTPIALGKSLLFICVFVGYCYFYYQCASIDKICIFCLGSAEGFSLAEKAISSASRNGR